MTTNKSEDMYDETDFIDLPHRGRCKVYIARYSYDPIKQSPNENPEAELKLMAGDYVLIFGEMDEDGFFNGELLDGRKGIGAIKLREELYEFQSQVLYGTRDSDDGTSSLIFHDGDLAGDDPQMFCRVESKITTEDFHRMNDYIDLEDLEEFEEEYLTELERDEGPVPPPTRLVLERQLNKSILIGWCPPDAPRERRKRITSMWMESPKLQSGPLKNKSFNIPLAPSCVKALGVTSTSAVICWLPSNSNFQHVVAINSVEVKTLKPGIFRHPISGKCLLKGGWFSAQYNVPSVRESQTGPPVLQPRKSQKIGLLTSAIEFKTLPKGCKG
ncbi:RIMS-binding protein 2 [Caerostris extrusa]|uniref:RIMS-binding protein 2 n=1 Tax=Caerostris extrusa TaxID=172846 RepID=A0AAV4RYN4_CAEEX|nr:RIMS-binding protein 2 [Caerostris extrusa]